jgi:hypothetical protein
MLPDASFFCKTNKVLYAADGKTGGGNREKRGQKPVKTGRSPIFARSPSFALSAKGWASSIIVNRLGF